MKRRLLLGTTVLSGLFITCAAGAAKAADLTVAPGSPLTVDSAVTYGQLDVGTNNGAGQVTVTPAGKLTTSTANMGAGTATGSSASVQGEWNTDQFTLGTNAGGNTFDMSGSASVTATQYFKIGEESGAPAGTILGGNTATLGGSSALTAGQLVVGGRSDNNSLTTLRGSTATVDVSGDVSIGFASNTNTLEIGASPSAPDAFHADGNVFVGEGGDGNQLNISGGAHSSVGGAVVLGQNDGASNNALHVQGAGTTLDITNQLYVGASSNAGIGGSGNSATIDGGARVSASATIIGTSTGGDNSVTIDGAGSKLSTKSIDIGRTASGNSMVISNGGVAEVNKGGTAGGTNVVRISAGGNATGTGNSLTVTGAGSLLDASGADIVIGTSASQATMRVSDGAEVRGGLVTVDGNWGGVEKPKVGLTVEGADTRMTATGLVIGGAQDASTESAPDVVVVQKGASLSLGADGDATVGGQSMGWLLIRGSNTTFTSDVVNVGVGNEFQNVFSIIDGASATTGAITVGGTSVLDVGIGASLSASTVMLNPGSELDVAIDGANSSTFTASGAATIDGAKLANFDPMLPNRNKHIILHADGGVSGEFVNNLQLANPDSLTYTVNYDANDVYLSFTSTLAQSPTGNFDGNEKRVAAGIDRALNGGETLTAGLSALYGLRGSDLNTALTEVSGEAGASAGVNAIERATGSFLGLLVGGGRQDGAGPRQYAAAAPAETGIVPVADPEPARQGWATWGAAYGGAANLPGDNGKGSHDTSTNVGAIATGWDYAVSPDTRLGLAVAGGKTNWDLSSNLGSGDSTFLQLGAYGRQQLGDAYLSFAGAYAWHAVSTDRKVTIDGTDKLTADFNASNLSGRAETGYRFAADGTLGITPYAAIQAQSVWMPGYHEDGGDVALSYQSNTDTSVTSELGLGLDAGVTDARLYARAAWAHDWNSNPSVQANFTSIGLSSFTVTGAQAPDNLALVTAGAEFTLSDAAALGASFDGEFGQDYQSYAGSLSLRYSM